MREKVEEIFRLDPKHFSVVDRFFSFVKAFRSEGVESSARASLDEVYDTSGS